MIGKVVLAYSGGLDTSVIIPWLKENYGNPEIVAVCMNVGQTPELVGIEERAKKTGADKLYIETLEIAGTQGPEERVIVSGLVPFYKEEELLNRNIILAYNLKPAKLRGIDSRGMLLAASDNEGPADAEGKGTERVEVLDAADVPTGTRVTIEGIGSGTEGEPLPAEIDIETFFSIPLEVKDNTVTVGGKALILDGKQIKTKIISSGEVH